MVLETCALYGATNYTNNWLGINFLIILLTLLITAVIYTLGKFMPRRTSAKITEMSRYEMVQAVLSAIIIAVLLVMAQTFCNLSTSISQQIVGTPLTPFQYADYYIGNLSVNTGITLLTNLYGASISYSIEGSILSSVAGEGVFSQILTILEKTLKFTKFVTIKVTANADLGLFFETISALYLELFAPIITGAIGFLFLQFLALPALQYTAFIVVLPVALAMRSLGFTGAGMRNAANAFLALAVAAYLIYPMTVAFDSYVVYYIFSPTNPTSAFLGATYTLPSLVPANFFNAISTTGNNYFGGQAQFGGTPGAVFSSLQNFGGILSLASNPFLVISQARSLVNNIAEFLFVAILLFGVNIMLTIAFAISLSNALNAGIEGAASLWSNL